MVEQTEASSHINIGAISMKVIEQKEKAMAGLPKQIPKYVDLFLDDNVRENNILPQHRPRVDTKFTLQQDENSQSKKVP